MGIYPPPQLCFITGKATNNIDNSEQIILYYIDYFDDRITFKFNFNHTNSTFVNENLHILRGLILNKKIDFSTIDTIIKNELLEQIILEAQVPKTPKDKLDNLLLLLFSNQDYEGSDINLNKKYTWEYIYIKNYFKNRNEFSFYLKTLRDYGLIDFMDAASKDGPNAVHINLTFKGLEYVIELQENGQNSNKCFIAMSFSNSDEIYSIRQKLKSILKNQGYEPVLIDEMHFESDKTINDAMISYIKQSKFMIADFTEHKHGVYFEAGFALGLKRPVIYTCSSEYFKLTHFDTNHYPHIVYDNLDDLENKLINKIAAWID